MPTKTSITKPILESACATLATIISTKTFNSLKFVQSQIAFIAKGHTVDTNNNTVNNEATLCYPYTHTQQSILQTPGTIHQTRTPTEQTTL